MSRKYTAYPSEYQGARTHYSEMEKGEIATFTVKWGGVLGALGTTGSSGDWTTVDTGVIAIASEALSSGVATVKVTASEVGTALLSHQITCADGSVREQKFCITVIDTY